MKIKFCRICLSQDMNDYLNLGKMAPADSFVNTNSKKNQSYFPLEVCICQNCGMSQLNYTVPPDILYQNEYPYESSITETGRKHFFEMASEVVSEVNVKKGELVIDIGSNVGVLLQGFVNKNCKVLGIEPAGNIASKAKSSGIETINDFVSQTLAKSIVQDYGKAEVVCITNVFAHIHDLDDLMASIDIMLSEKGCFIIEAPHFLSLVQNLEYDTIYHEHLLYITIKPLSKLFARFGFVINNVKKVKIHGGSVRISVSRIGVRPISGKVEAIIEDEVKAGLFDIEKLNVFRVKVEEHRKNIRKVILNLHKRGYRIAAVSAPAKGMTLLNYCGLDDKIIEFVTEKSLLKIGKFTPGGLIPVVSDDHLLETMPDYALLLAWNFKTEIKKNLKKYTDSGGKFIIPIPTPVFE